MYLSWSAFYEGRTDSQYFNVLIPKVLDDIIRRGGKRPCDVGEFPAVEFGITDRGFENAAEDICARKEEFDIIFVHADVGGRGQAENIEKRRDALVSKAREICDFDPGKAVMLSPKKELEAWALSDPAALKSALGIREIPGNYMPDSPRDAERLADPKRNLQEIIRLVVGGKSAERQILVRIAQEQDISELRRAHSFQEFETQLREVLTQCGFMR